MRKLGTWLVRHSKLALFGFVGLIFLSSILGVQALDNLKGGGYDNPNSDSARVTELLLAEFDVDPAEVLVLVDLPTAADAAPATETAPAQPDPQNFELIQELSAELAAIEGVKGVLNYYTLGSPERLKSQDGTLIYVLVDLVDTAAQSPIVGQIVDDYTGNYRGAEVYVAGFGAITKAINEQIQSDLIRAELIAVPIILILLVLVFGSLIAAGLPLMVGGLSILGSLFFVWVFSQFTDISIFALNLITGLGLALGIDYSLLVVNRWREERAAGNSVADATVNTVNSAGRTVVFSGLTVAVVLLSLWVFPQYFLQSFALAGFVVVMLAVLGAIIAVPAALNLLGDRVNSLRIIKRDLTPKDTGFWERLARFTMRRPLPIMFLSLLLLGGLFGLSSGVQFGQVDDRVLPADNIAVEATDLLRERFDGRAASPVEILVRGGTEQEIADYLVKIEALDSTVRAYPLPTAAGANSDWVWLEAIGDVETRSPAGYEQIVEIRALEHGFDEVLIGGGAAYYTDSQQGIEQALPLAIGWIIISTLLLLFLFTGSLLLPIKAVLLNALSLGATLGFISWVFMNGELKWLIGEYTVTGTIDTSSVVMIAVVAFGLSMDYELFLLSRIKEQHDAGMNTANSVALGLQRSGRIITAAALVLAFTFLAFASSEVSIMKMLGLGIAFAILLDATVVRALLVPAIMRLFGRANWWAPRWMKAIYERVGAAH